MASDPASSRSTGQLSTNIPGAYPDVRPLSEASGPLHSTSLTQAVYERRAEYTRSTDVRIKVGTWNTAAQKGTEEDLGGWFVKGKGVEEALAGFGVSDDGAGSRRESVASQEARHNARTSTVPDHDDGAVPGKEQIDIYVLGLQEIVDITSPAEALRPYTDLTVAKKWKASLHNALPKHYQLVAEQQLIGLLLLIYASPRIFPHIKNVSTTSVGTGLMGYMGNKGAVTTRIILGETTRLVFVNCHLAAGADKAALERRSWDYGQIISRTRFDPIVDALSSSLGAGEGLGDEDFAFWFGDLNFRLEGIPGDDVRHLLTVHTKNMEINHEQRSSSSVDSSSNSRQSSDADDAIPLPPDPDPASLQTTITSLILHDELHQQMKNGKAFSDGWIEGPVQFLPSYKYDIGKVGVFDSSEKRRCPSWCDRILYRTRAAKERHDSQRKEKDESRKRDEAMKDGGLITTEEDVLYDYDPDIDGDNEDDNEDNDGENDHTFDTVTTKDDLTAEIALECYTTHMRVLSSDHKPLDAVFSLRYDAVVPDLKAAIYAEVARELDRQENEGRPSITVAIDRSTGTSIADESAKTDSPFDGVDFDDVRYGKSKKRNITIANTGRVLATFGFSDRPVTQDQPGGPFPSWLSVTFDREPDKSTKQEDIHRKFTLEPADVLNAELKVKIESMSAVRNLNGGNMDLDDVLVISVDNGRDHFLPVRAHWLQSALARSLDKLVKIPEGGIRKLQNQIPSREEVKWSVPREIFRLTEAIEDLIERTLAEWDMTKNDDEKAPWQNNAGYPFVRSHRRTSRQEQEHGYQLPDVIEALDCDTSLADAFDPETKTAERVEVLADTLLTFLANLTDGVITVSLWEKVEESIIAREKMKRHLSPDEEKMFVLEITAGAPSHNATFLLLISFLQNIANQITDTSKPPPNSPRTSLELPASPRARVCKRTLSKEIDLAIRQVIVRNYAVVFADVLFRSKEGKVKEKEKAATKEKMVRLVQLFLNDGYLVN